VCGMTVETLATSLATMSFKALLVDLDGTLVDSASANIAAYRAATAQFDIVMDEEAVTAIAHGLHWRQFLPPLLVRAGSTADLAAIVQQKARLFPEMVPRICVNHALVQLVSVYRNRCLTALVTSSSSANANAVLNHHRLASLFDTVVTGDEVSAHKPDPAGYIAAGRHLCVAPLDCVAIEDSDVGVAACIAFGAPVLRVRW